MKLNSDEVYISTDIESDGPIPGYHSMLSFASVALRADGTELGHFSANLERVPGTIEDPDTMEWWRKQWVAYAGTRENTETPEAAMARYCQWLRQWQRPVFVAFPAGFDFTFMRWYLVRFTGTDPFAFAALDIKTLAYALTELDFRECRKKNFPKSWKPKGLPHTHVALDDAREQGQMFTNMLKQWTASR